MGGVSWTQRTGQFFQDKNISELGSMQTFKWVWLIDCQTLLRQILPGTTLGMWQCVVKLLCTPCSTASSTGINNTGGNPHSKELNHRSASQTPHLQAHLLLPSSNSCLTKRQSAVHHSWLWNSLQDSDLDVLKTVLSLLKSEISLKIFIFFTHANKVWLQNETLLFVHLLCTLFSTCYHELNGKYHSYLHLCAPMIICYNVSVGT